MIADCDTKCIESSYMEADTAVFEEESMNCRIRSLNKGVGHLKVLYL